MSQINYTRASMSPIKSLVLEVSAGRETLISVAYVDDTWKVLMNGSNPNNTQPVQISWQEFLEIVHEIQKFVVIENERLIAADEAE